MGTPAYFNHLSEETAFMTSYLSPLFMTKPFKKGVLKLTKKNFPLDEPSCPHNPKGKNYYTLIEVVHYMHAGYRKQTAFLRQVVIELQCKP